MRRRRVATKWTMRAQPEQGTLPAIPAQKVEIDFDGGLYDAFSGLRAQVTDGERVLMSPGTEREAVVDEMHVLAEIAHFLDARVVSPEEMEARGLRFELLTAEELALGSGTAAHTETLVAMEIPEGDGGFKVPEKAKREIMAREKAKRGVAEEQTSLLGEPEPSRDEPEEEDPRVQPSAVGTPGVYGGRVPSFSLPEAVEVFERWKQDEFGWLKTRVLLLAREHGEYHSTMLVGLPLSNRNLIGALTNSLSAQGLFEMLNKGGEVETRISSPTSRRRSNVWRLTMTGYTMADDLARSPQIAMWAFPERSHAA